VPDGPELRTARLLLRRWLPSDREPFARLNADPETMRYFPKPLTPAESDAFVDLIEAAFARNGFGFWAVELREAGTFIGFVGLSAPSFEAHFTPCIEIGWRLAAPFWNQGYATEGARAALAFGFDVLKVPEIVAFTAVGNAPSRRVMEKLGMTRDPADDFDHPRVAAGHPLQRHVLYRTARMPCDPPGFATATVPSP
jgi:RimJ/RimL family protein N-acetyltransferase